MFSIPLELDLGYVDPSPYAMLRNETAEVFNGSSFEPYATGNLQKYKIAVSMREITNRGSFWDIAFPNEVADGKHVICVYIQDGSKPTEQDRLICANSVRKNGNRIEAC